MIMIVLPTYLTVLHSDVGEVGRSGCLASVHLSMNCSITCMLLLLIKTLSVSKAVLECSKLPRFCNNYRSLTAIAMNPAKRSHTQDNQPSKRLKASEIFGSGEDEARQLPFEPSGFQLSRARLLTKQNRKLPEGNCVVLWMSRDQRVHDNHAFHYAQSIAMAHNLPLRVVFNLVPRFLEATIRQYGFMIKGLKEVEMTLRDLRIPFHLLLGNPTENLPHFVREHQGIMLVTDFSPLRVGLSWVHSVAASLDETSQAPLVQVDAHNIVPCWVASPKLEYSARTFRGKITPKIPEYLRAVPPPQHNPDDAPFDTTPVDWESALASLEINRDVPEVTWLRPGYAAAQEVLREFINLRLKDYGDKRNDPNLQVASNLSPYIHFGHISVEQAVLTLKAMKKSGSSVDSFIEEAVVRRELTDNFCYCKSTITVCLDFSN